MVVFMSSSVSGRGFDFALPAVDGFDSGDQCNAGGKVLLDKSVGEAARFVDVGAGGEHETDVARWAWVGL